MIIHSNIDTLLTDKFLRWSETVLSNKQTKNDIFAVIGDTKRSDDGTRANELFRLDLFCGSLMGKKAGWNLLKENKNIHSRLGFLSYIIGKAINAGYSSEKTEKAFGALCTLFALQTGEVGDKCFTVVGLSFYIKKYFPHDKDINEIKYWRYLTSLLFCTWYDDTYKSDLLADYFAQKPINQLFIIDNGNTEKITNNEFNTLLNTNRSLSSITPPKYSLFWVGNYSDIKPRGVFSQGLLVGRKLLEIASEIEYKAISNKEISPFCTVINKPDNIIIPCVIEELQKIFSTNEEAKKEFSKLMKTLYEGVNDALNFLAPKQPQSSFDTVICNKIYFGCPGTGKSHKINEIINNIDKNQWERVTFHPEYDYASFVGAYKPFSTKDGNNKDIIKYDFVPQTFTNIYVRAWKGLENIRSVPYFLIIEEINRGNCAEIFGDIFQLLDRNANYEVSTSQELNKYLIEQLGETHEGIINGLKLPPNLILLATMNTSDQSLFPMDSAFKRRWEWEYVPINYKEAENQVIQILDKKYSWASFLKVINEKIYQITESEDKQMGNRFVNTTGVITEDILLNKVMFYLWFDVFKNEDSRNLHYIFKKNPIEKFKYADLFDENGTQTLTLFLAHNQIAEI